MTVRFALLAGALVACGDLKTFSGDVPPLASFHVEVTGDLTGVRPGSDTGAPDLKVALVWGQQWLTEAFCILPPETADASAVIAAGCRDPFGFVPAQADVSVPVTIGEPATLDLYTLPDASLLVGDLTARVGYATFVVYDDRNHDGGLTLARPDRLGQATMGPPRPDPTPTHLPDRIYGASFLTMTAPDVRVAYREGAFIEAAFYPRAGCADPAPAFSVLSAGGFSAADAIAATLAGTLPQEPAGSCAAAAPADATIQLAIQPPADVTEVACTERNADSSVRYREPTAMAPDLTGRTTACVHVPSFGSGSGATEIELIVTGLPTDSCKGLTHYILKGCREGPDCGTPDWDHSQAPPSWWPC